MKPWTEYHYIRDKQTNFEYARHATICTQQQFGSYYGELNMKMGDKQKHTFRKPRL